MYCRDYFNVEHSLILRKQRVSTMKPAYPLPIFLLLLVVMSVSWLATSTAQAQMRCGTELVETGESVLTLLKACGKPTIGYTTHDDNAEWIYNFGPHKFIKKVIIRDGQVERVETLKRGYVPEFGTGSPAYKEP
jgi:hypothetical protein